MISYFRTVFPIAEVRSVGLSAACLHRGRVYNNTVEIVVRDVCRRCFCRDGSVTCSELACPSLACRRSVVPPGECCATCAAGCAGRPDGSRWREGPCRTCVCQVGDTTVDRRHPRAPRRLAFRFALTPETGFMSIRRVHIVMSLTRLLGS